ncbi:Testis-specific chromodomain protein Y 2 [Orchesella cincta]|uniref:Testis-specific chromodomain protein Y 2 n=1 Tax=Orchesella cincta TaxID=48709 RepID=A0A1D2NG59_ORCCI|nr:Testis-specific chromodomain protein Y 2 [Orchesella cincta]
MNAELEVPPGGQRTKPRRRRIRSELDRLLSDEGTRNLLRAIKKTGTNKNPTNVFRKRIGVKKRVRVVKRIKEPSVVDEKHANQIDYNVIALHSRANVGYISVSFKDNSVEYAREGAFNIKVLQSVDNAIKSYEQDSNVTVIVLQSSHSKYFCNGIDLHDVLQNGKDKTTASNLVKAIKSLVTTLNSCRKLVVASISGDCVGFGVMILPLFDIVYASDKSMFRVHYNALGQSPEGIALFKNHLCGAGIGIGKVCTYTLQATVHSP